MILASAVQGRSTMACRRLVEVGAGGRIFSGGHDIVCRMDWGLKMVGPKPAIARLEFSVKYIGPNTYRFVGLQIYKSVLRATIRYEYMYLKDLYSGKLRLGD